MDAITQARCGELYPEFARIWLLCDQQAAVILAPLGITIRMDQGLRNWPQQSILWQLGRNPDGSYIDPVHETGVVTHAKAGESWHNYGLAGDFVPMLNGVPIWDRTTIGYSTFIRIAESNGLTSGSCWQGDKKDFPHLQLTGNFPVDAPDDYVKALFAGGGLRAVWDEVDKALGITH